MADNLKPAKWQKSIFVENELEGQAWVRNIDHLHEARTNADDWMVLVRQRSGDRVMS